VTIVHHVLHTTPGVSFGVDGTVANKGLRVTAEIEMYWI